MRGRMRCHGERPLWRLAVGTVLGLMLLGGAAAAATPSQDAGTVLPDATYKLTVHGDLYIGPEGTVTDLELRNADLTTEIAALVDRQVRKWRFEPILVDGRAVNAKTRMKLELSLEPVAGGHQLRVVGVGFGNPVRHSRRLRPPDYPMEARRADVGADVTLLLTIDAEGRVAKVDVRSTSLTGKGPQEVMVAWADMFEHSAKLGARRWRFEMTESVDGKPVSTRVLVPVSFRIEGMERNWVTMVPVVRPGHYLERGSRDDDARLADASGGGTGEPQAIDSRFRLKDEVVGRAL